MPNRRRQWIALILSGVFPGFGQLYLRAWMKGGVFIVAGVMASWALGQLVSVEDLLTGLLPHPGATLGLTLTLLALYLWSSVDAWMFAGKG
jgi:hypothetical protein